VVVIRRATPRDAASVARLVDALLMELGGGSPSRYADRVATAERLLTHDDRLFAFLAFAGERAIGVMMLSESAAIYADGQFGVITELYVVPEHRSGGVAKMLVDAGVALGRERAWRRIEVGAPHQPEWARTLSFYLRAGFIEIGPRLKLFL
jgi:GNAT superfamily N-acetyltransferase